MLLLWVAMAVLAALASLSVLVPLTRSRRAARAEAAEEVSVYRDQLGEVDRDLDRGVIGETEAQAARTEIARRLIKADDRSASEPQAERRAPKLAVLLGLVALPAFAVGLYLLLGSPDLPDAPLAARLSAPPENQDLATLMAKVETHLAEHPDDAEGWQVIAPVYIRTGRFDDAVRAYANVVRILGPTAEREGLLGEAMVRANQGLVTADARAAFERAAALDGEAVMPRFYLGVALAQEGKTKEAAAALKDLIAGAPAGAPWIGFVQQTLTRLEAGPAGIPGPSMPGPSADDVKAAEGMTPEQRMVMIEGMVGQLAARLKTEPKDADGWVRLIRAYMVLGRSDDAKAALASARTALAGDSRLDTVEQVARSVGVQ